VDFERGELHARSRARRFCSRFPISDCRRTRGFTLIELLVAVVVFAALAAAAYGGLSQIARARTALAAQQDRFGAVTRAVTSLERDLHQALGRSVLGNRGSTPLPALMGSADSVELSRLGYANPRAEPRSNIERVVYALDANRLRRGRYAVLDRAPNSAPVLTTLADQVQSLRLRYYGCDGIWRDAWPPSERLPCDPPQGSVSGAENTLPRAVEFRVVFSGLGEIRRVVELPSSLPDAAASLPGGGGGGGGGGGAISPPVNPSSPGSNGLAPPNTSPPPSPTAPKTP
jgi:general secretion pathway protein J